MPLKIRTHKRWQQKTREGRYVTHFDRTVSIDDCTSLPFGRKCPPSSEAPHGYAPGLEFHLKFETDYHTDPIIVIKVVEGLDLLKAVRIHVKCISGRIYNDHFYHPSIESLRQESGFSKSTEILTESSEYFRDMFIPKNLPHLKDIDVTYIIDFDLDLKDPEEWGFRWMPLGSSGAEKLLEKLYLNDELSDVKIYCEDKIFNCHKLILGGKSKVFKNMLFNNEMVEATSGEIKIVDTPADAMENLLYYIYHGSLKSIATITHDLLMAADKYDIPDLVNICNKLMIVNMNEKNVMNVMTSAFLTNQKELFKMACEFVFKRSRNGQSVEIEAWKEFKEKNPVLANKMLEKAMFNL